MICVLTFFGIVGTSINMLIPTDLWTQDWNPEDPGDYPENGTSEEQDEWNETKLDWDTQQAVVEMIDEMDEINDLQFWSMLVSLLIAVPSVVLLFSRNRYGFHTSGGWIAWGALSQMYIGYRSSLVAKKLYESIPGVDFGALSDIQTGLSIGGALVCNLMLLAVIVLCAVKSIDHGEIPASGYHVAAQTTEPSEQVYIQPPQH